MVNNLDWTAPMSAIEFLRDIGKHFRVNTHDPQGRDRRAAGQQDGISFTEFSYQLLQGMDYLHLFREYGCTLQTGGVDQWGNLTAGVDLIRRVEGASVHVLTTPLVTKADGTKFGKTEGGTVWLDAEMTSPVRVLPVLAQRRGRVRGQLPQVFTDRSRADHRRARAPARESRSAREAQRALAADVTTLVHGAAATAAVQAASEALFGKGDLRALDVRTLRDATAEVPGGYVPSRDARSSRRS